MRPSHDVFVLRANVHFQRRSQAQYFAHHDNYSPYQTREAFVSDKIAFSAKTKWCTGPIPDGHFVHSSIMFCSVDAVDVKNKNNIYMLRYFEHLIYYRKDSWVCVWFIGFSLVTQLQSTWKWFLGHLLEAICWLIVSHRRWTQTWRTCLSLLITIVVGYDHLFVSFWNTVFQNMFDIYRLFHLWNRCGSLQSSTLMIQTSLYDSNIPFVIACVSIYPSGHPC